MKHQKTKPSKIRTRHVPQDRKTKALQQPTVNNLHFSCTFCDEYFTQKQLLLRHLKLHKGSIGQRKNDTEDVEEGERFTDKSHQRLEFTREDPLYLCEHCGKSCTCKTGLVKHLVSSVFNEKVKEHFTCQICNKEFRFKCLLTKHLEQHDIKKPQPCRTCGKLFTMMKSLVKHELQHEGKGTFKCRSCGERFTTEEERNNHKEANHKKPWKCSICHHAFMAESKLEAHLQWHQNKMTEIFLCNFCGKEFKLKVNLKAHVESKCGTEPQHGCKDCGKAFMTRGILVTHMLLHTGEKTFLCRFCGKNFRLKVEMQRHERSHTGEKPFVCKVCNKAFPYRESLVVHNTLHTGKKPFMCEVCGSTFSCIGNLIKHRRVYGGKCGEISVNTKKSSKRSMANKINVSSAVETAIPPATGVPVSKELTFNVGSTEQPPASVVPATSLDVQPSTAESLVPIKPVETTLVFTSTIINLDKTFVVTTPVIPINGDAANEMSIAQGNYYGCTNPSYENNTEWLAPVFTPSDPNVRIPMELNSGQSNSNIRSPHYYWGCNNTMAIHPHPVQHTFPSYGTVIRDPLKPEYTFQDLTHFNPAQDGVGQERTPMGVFQTIGNSTFQTPETKDESNGFEPIECVGDKLEDISQNCKTIFNRTNYETSNVSACDKIETITDTSNVLIPNIVDDSTQTDMIEISVSKINSRTIPESDLQVKVELSDKFAMDGIENLSLDDSCEPETELEVDNNLCVSGIKSEESSDDSDDFQLSITPEDNKESSIFKCENYSNDMVNTDSGRSETNNVKADIVLALRESVKDENKIDEKTQLCTKNSTHDEETVVKHSEIYNHLNGKIKNNKKKISCEHCNKEFDFISRLNRHIRCHDVGSRQVFFCQFCERKYTNKACLDKHELLHSANGGFKCKECDEKFNTRTEYRSHRSKRHRKQWICTVCERSFSTSSNLKNHTKNKHLGEDTGALYVCHICGRAFKQKTNLKIHLESQCGTDPQFVCSVCGKAFMSYGSLGTHLLVHTGEKAFLCRFCGKSYRLKVEMQRHERSHTGEKPFVCKECGKAFGHRESLVTHSSIHTGIKPYVCQVCGAAFSCIGNLIKHRQTRNRRCDIARADLNTVPQDSAVLV